MWWSKHSHSATSTFSPAFNSTGTMDPPDAEEVRHPARTFSRPTLNTWPESGALGNNTAGADLQLDAVVLQPILLKCRRLTIGPAAKATGVVIAQELIVYGEFAGNLRASDRIEIKKNGVVIGDLTSRSIVIEEGAVFNGTAQIERRKKPRAVPELAKSAAG